MNNARGKKCPQCAELVKLEAKVCRHCAYQFSSEEMAAAHQRMAQDFWVRTGGTVIIFVLVIFCLVQFNKAHSPAASNSGPDSKSDVLLNEADATIDAANRAVSDATKPAANWNYRADKDEMRGTTTRYAQADSDNAVELPMPYQGGSRAHIIIRHRPSDGLQIMLQLDKGQILCRSFERTVIHVKFDSGPVRAFGCTDEAEGDSTVAFFQSKSALLAGLKHAKRVMIEPDLYEYGGAQFTFNTAGLIWK